MTDTWHHPEAIVSGDWLEAHLADPNLRIYDCTTYPRYEEGTERPYRVESGRADWEAGHIPGAMHLDLQADFSEDDAPTRFMRRSPAECSAKFARHGMGDDTRVVLYSRKSPQWATRFWWMLRWIGFDKAAVLDGVMDKWEAEGRPVTTEPASYPPGTLTARPRPGLFVGKKEMLAGDWRRRGMLTERSRCHCQRRSKSRPIGGAKVCHLGDRELLLGRGARLARALPE